MTSRILILVLAALLAAGLVLPAAVETSNAAAGEAASYSWPVKPFDRPHPVRGGFGDPRTTFNAPPTYRVLMYGSGIFHFHEGVDISAPDGTPVYAVKSGTARLLSGRTVAVDSGAGVVFQYWHIVPAVRTGQSVAAHETVLGRIQVGYEHVHLTELRNGYAVNPLAPGHMGPYGDSTRPRVSSVAFRRAGSSAPLLAEFVSGQVDLFAEAHDPTALPVPGKWANLAVAPALVTWRIERANDHSVARSEAVAFDVRDGLPQLPFWRAYMRGTRQNASVFAGHKYMRQPGVYLFRLGPVFDTHVLQNGIYVLVVTARDTAGNAGSLRQVFSVRNAR